MTYPPRSLRNLPQQLINSKLKVKLPTVLVAVIHNFPSFHSYCLDVFVYLVDLGSLVGYVADNLFECRSFIPLRSAFLQTSLNPHHDPMVAEDEYTPKYRADTPEYVSQYDKGDL